MAARCGALYRRWRRHGGARSFGLLSALVAADPRARLRAAAAVPDRPPQGSVHPRRAHVPRPPQGGLSVDPWRACGREQEAVFRAQSSSSRRLASSRRSRRREGRERRVFGVVQTRARTPGAWGSLARSRSLARSHGAPSLARRRDMRLSHATVARSSCDRGERGNGASNAPPRPPTSRRPPPSWPRRSHVRCFAPMLLSLPGTTPTMTAAPAMATAAVATAAMATATAATARPIAAASPPAASRSRRLCSTCSRGSASRIRECSLGRSASRCVTRTARRRGAATAVTTRLAEPQPLRVVTRRASSGAELSSSSDARPA